MVTHLRALLTLALLLTAGACSTEKPTTTTTTAQCDLNNPATTTTAATVTDPAKLGIKKVELASHDAGPHNLWWLRQPGAADGQGGLLSGSVPEKPADFTQLAALGIKTVISVDGSAPDAEAAAKAGLTYIHIPATYAEVTSDQQVEVARAINASLPNGSVYIHCHHGKHRSPAQAAAAAVGLGWMTPEQAVAFMKQAGTAPTYEGLYACVAESKPLDAAVIKAPIRDGEFVAVRKPAGIVGAMVEVDLAYEHLGQIKGAGWKTPADSPDLVPSAEAGRLADHLRYSAEDPRAKAHGDAFMKQLAEAVTKASALEEALVKKSDTKQLDALWAPVVASCKDCHKQFRDKR